MTSRAGAVQPRRQRSSVAASRSSHRSGGQRGGLGRLDPVCRPSQRLTAAGRPHGAGGSGCSVRTNSLRLSARARTSSRKRRFTLRVRCTPSFLLGHEFVSGLHRRNRAPRWGTLAAPERRGTTELRHHSPRTHRFYRKICLARARCEPDRSRDTFRRLPPPTRHPTGRSTAATSAWR